MAGVAEQGIGGLRAAFFSLDGHASVPRMKKHLGR
jgi:hypothetical protein